MATAIKENLFSHRKPITWFLVADGETAQVYVRSRDEIKIPMQGNAKHHHYAQEAEPRMIPVPDMHWTAESLAGFEAGNHQLGRVFESGNAARHSVAPHMDIHEELKLRFMHTVAEQVRTAYTNKSFDYIVLIAPPRLLGELKKNLEPHILGRVLAELPKELTGCNGGELLGHIENLQGM